MEKVPKVFISYSHDTPDHKRWVGELASKLVENGVDVILDQWDLGPGDDLAKFMEHSVRDSDRVLMICTENYVKKSNDGHGGVGYEAMIVTSEIVRNLGTSKFIPVVREVTNEAQLPNSVSTRFYINLSDDENINEQFEDLLRELHQTPKSKKPSLGKNPYESKQISSSTSNSEINSNIPQIDNFQSIVEIYNTALDLARRGDIVAWRKIIRQAKKPIFEELKAWREKYETNSPENEGNLIEAVYEGISIYAPVFSIALAGIESGREQFNTQASLLYEILHPREWNYSGLTILVGLPDAIGFTYQALHGAVCLYTNQTSLAVNLANNKFKRGYNDETLSLYQNPYIIGWPDSLTGSCSVALKFLLGLPERWEWLNEIFGESYEFEVSLCAYYLSLNILEFSDILTNYDSLSDSEKQMIFSDSGRLKVPLSFKAFSRDLNIRAYRLLLSNPDQLRGIWRNLKVEDSKVEQYWHIWISHLSGILNKSYPLRSNIDIPHRTLFTDLPVSNNIS